MINKKLQNQKIKQNLSLIGLDTTYWQVMIFIMIQMMTVRMKALRNIRLVGIIQSILEKF